jgi:NAD(P)-dependent dehydrogenase (short-subunit alcohol dehydrogenase family)
VNTKAKTVLITGASSGIGKATAGLLADEGWNVIATMPHLDEGVELAARANVLVRRLDVADKPSIERAIADGVDRFGAIDVLVNNAGVLVMGVFEAVSDEQIRRLFEINVFGVMNMTRAVLPRFRAQGAGLIVNVTSAVALIPLPLFSHYVASKAAIEAFSEGLVYELAPQNIRIKIVEPGAVLTRMTMQAADDAAKLPKIPDYEKFIAHILDMNAAAAARGMPGPEPVARAIVQTISDPGDRLRYLAGEDFVDLLRSRKDLDEEVFLSKLRKQYLPN